MKKTIICQYAITGEHHTKQQGTSLGFGSHTFSPPPFYVTGIREGNHQPLTICVPC